MKRIARTLSRLRVLAQRARAASGSIQARRDEARDALGLRVLADLQTDTMFALRLLRRSPAFTAIAVLSLALGIGANVAIFSLIDTVLLKSLPVAQPDTLFFVDNSGGKSGGTSGPPYPCFELLRDHNRTLAGIAAFDEVRFKVTIDDGAAEQWRGQYASGNYFDVLGVRAVHGRVLTPADDAIVGQGGSHGAVAVISDALWERRFARNPAVVGKTLLVGTRRVIIVGVTGPDFSGLRVGSPIDITIPITLAGNNVRARSLWWFSVVARLKSNVTREQARAELHAMWDGYMTDIGEPRDKRGYFSGIELVPAARGLAAPRRQLMQPLTIVMTIVGLVLLIGCANLANLLLARASARQHEFAVRLAIGASRSRLIRQLLTEGVVLAACASLAGVMFARFGTWFLIGFLGTVDDGLLLTTRFDGRLLAFTGAIGVLTALLFSLAPAIQATRPSGEQPAGPGSTMLARPRVRLAQLLVLVQVSLAVVLLSGAALFVRTLLNLQRVPSGFDREGVLTIEVEATIPRSTIAKPTPAEHKQYFGHAGSLWSLMQERLATMPGVAAAAAATLSPLAGRDRGVAIAVSGASIPQKDRSIHVNQVTAGYFEALGTELLAGRWFTTRDRAASARVAVLNQTAARTYFGDRNPIGQKVTFPGQHVPDEYEIVGIVGDMRYESLRLPAERMAYLPIEQSLEALASAVVVVRAEGDVSRYTGVIRDLAAEALPGGFVTRVTTLDRRVRESLVLERLLSVLASFFGALALTLGCLGLYGVMAFAVVRRTREIGIRIAIGARASAVSWMVVRETLVPVVFGVVIGGGTGWIGARFVQSQLFGVAPGDVVATSIAILMLLLVAGLAAYVPSRRASRIDPVIALRCE